MGREEPTAPPQSMAGIRCLADPRAGFEDNGLRHPFRFIVAAGFTLKAAAPALGHGAHQWAGGAAAARGATPVDQTPEVATVPAGPVLCDPWGEVDIHRASLSRAWHAG